MHTGIDPIAIGDWLGNAKTSLDLIKGARSLFPQGTKRDELDAKIRDAEDALARSDAALAKQLGFQLCQCSFPPKIMLWKQGQSVFACPDSNCGRLFQPGQDAATAMRKIPAAKVCPLCDAEMQVLSETPHPEFGVFGVKVHAMVCKGCGNKTDRRFDPNKGYGS